MSDAKPEKTNFEWPSDTWVEYAVDEPETVCDLNLWTAGVDSLGITVYPVLRDITGHKETDMTEALFSARVIADGTDLARQFDAVPGLLRALAQARDALSNAQGEWAAVDEAHAPEWTHPLKAATGEIEAAFAALKGDPSPQ